MSRVDDALKRATAATTAATDVPAAGRNHEHVDRAVLQLYPAEERLTAPAPVAVSQPASGRTRGLSGAVVAPRFSPASRGKLVNDPSVSPVSIEQYRRLAATMHHIQAEQNLRHLMVSSASPREGKTLTIVNLALTLSESYGRRVLLIDADLRRPSVHDVFGISNRYGLSHAIESDTMELRTTRICQNLWVLPAGTPHGNPTAALASRQMERLLGDATSAFDWVLLDAPPFGLVADTTLLARLVRAVILVIAAGSTQYASVEKAVAELGREYIVGTVLNRVEDNPRAGHYSDYIDVMGQPTDTAASDHNSGVAALEAKNIDCLRS
jgi:capsular exopolysaccharide synthesis family protein